MAHRLGVRPGRGVPLEQLVQAHLRQLGAGVVPVADDGVDLGGGEQAGELRPHPLDGGQVEQVGAVLDEALVAGAAVPQLEVEVDLGRIFTKLDVSSRAEIANMVGRATVTARPRRTRATAS
ncbi:hypothetical protein JOF53_006890 [Crossiella equi]|uniref:Uncharacterized protein n=1 Tax=Crossiella equi TaxID=130796 RepID=A0ABS5AN68_9PSEU|nr:hypothetical protein [Crossiella equi]MBP2478018.1 hypothetical protein [Crossiella equi]